MQSISDINHFVQCTTKHPLVAVFDFSKVDQYKEDEVRISADFYSIISKNYCSHTIRYGRQSLDFQDGSLVCIGPNQVITIDNETEAEKDVRGWGLFFHPDILYGSSLGDKIQEYSFFSYDMSEALHLSAKEEQILSDCIKKIETELLENIDEHSQRLLVSNIELLLNYCSRYYDRQFITRKRNNSKIAGQVERLLKACFEKNAESPLPSVKQLADMVNLSPGYLSDLLKKETGLNAQDLIHYHLIEAAKNMLLGTDYSVSQIAYSLGFEYPQYFSRLFKQKTGQTPIEFRNHN
ncbi:MAG: helix-turn-helix transcriptional regulator [Bacteroidia bacterium]